MLAYFVFTVCPYILLLHIATSSDDLQTSDVTIWLIIGTVRAYRRVREEIVLVCDHSFPLTNSVTLTDVKLLCCCHCDTFDK